MRLRSLALPLTIALGLLAAPLADGAEEPGRVFRIGVLGNIPIEYRSSEGKYERLPALAADLVRLKVDVIVAPSTAAPLAAKQATRSIPIVVIAVSDPVESGLVASLARPGETSQGRRLE